ncbi:MAG: hypothetical protein ACRBN8_25410 [Nannocystales bacterium]
MSLALVMLGMALGGSVTWLYLREQKEGLLGELGERQKELDSANAERTTADRKLALRERQLALAAAQRDDYAKIASTHEIDAPRWGAGEWARKVWKDRRYGGHPSENLADLRRDFVPFAEEHVLLAVGLELLGGWKSLLGEESSASITTPLSAGDTLLFEGPGARVLDQLSTFLLDDDTGFYEPAEPDSEGDAGRWRDENSPMVWRLTLDVLHPESPSHLQFVEVLRVHKELEEVIIERPVIRAVPDDVATSLGQHTKEEIVALIEAVLEVRELGPDRRIPAEQAALPASLQHRDGGSA